MELPTQTVVDPLVPHIAPLTKSFSVVSPAAVPAIIDCVIASSELSVSDLFFSLLRLFPNLSETYQSNYVLCHTSALCHLLKNERAPPHAMNQFISIIFIPLLKSINQSNSELLNKIEELVYDVVFENGFWELMNQTVVSFCLISAGISMNASRNGEMGACKLSTEHSSEHPGKIPPKTSYRALASLLDFASGCWREARESEQKLPGVLNAIHTFTVSLTQELFNLACGLLKLSREDRLDAIHLLLPAVFRSLNVFSPFRFLESGLQYTLSRTHFMEKIWECCSVLLSLGHLERRDAYMLLSQYFSIVDISCVNEKLPVVKLYEEFDLKCNSMFWEEMQRGLVDRDASVRKMVLYILKELLSYCSYPLVSGDCQISSCAHLDEDVKNIHTIPRDKNPSHFGLSKREKWAANEAKSMGVGVVSFADGPFLTGRERWKVFILLYEMLEEYDTHLVEAAWTHQVSLLLQSGTFGNYYDSTLGIYEVQMQSLEGFLSWLAVLWERGFTHDNPQVRCLIMQSFLGIDWVRYESYAQKVPRTFILGPLLRGLNDVVHHKDFGLKGVYTSRTTDGASKFLNIFSCRLSVSERLTLAWSLASAARHELFCRAGLMSLGYCISAIACHPINDEGLERQCPRANCESKLVASQSDVMQCSADELLDALGIVILKSKQHFNAKYRLQVSEQVLKAASLLTCTSDMSLVVLLHFLSAVPREFVDVNGPLRSMVQAWLTQNSCEEIDFGPSENQSHLLKNLFNFPLMFIALASKDSLSFDDEDVDSWLYEAQRWARVLFLVVRMENDLDPVFEFFRSYGGYLSQDIPGKWVGVKLLILILCFAEESEIILKKLKYDGKVRIGAEFSGELVNSSVETSLVTSEKFVGQFLPITEDVLCFARHVLAVFWSNSSVKDTLLPSSMTGKLGGPARRRLGISMTSSVLQSIVALRTIATIVSLTFLIKGDVLYSTFTFFWEFVWKVVQFHPHKSETGSELCLASYETLSYVLKTLSANFDASAFASLTSDNKLAFACGNGKPFLDHILVCFLSGINDLLANGVLTHSRRAILMDWKWNCLDSMMSIPYNVVKKGSPSSRCPLFSDSILRTTLADIIESLEAAGENSVLSMLRSLRLILGLLCSTKVGPVLSSSHGLNTQVMFQLVRSAWILHQSCNKRRVAPIAALLSAVLHESVFGDLTMHEMNDDKKGPLKWFIENLIDEGIKSPRTMRLAAMHLTGLWLLHPRTLKYYVKELKLMSLYGSVAFDEDFESELCENQDAKTEVSHLAQSPDPELTEVFINTEMYSRISVAVLFNKLANLVNGSRNQVNGDFVAALHCGKLFLLELLDSAVNERDLSKELYKKFSGVHRRKVRVWQMICVLSFFVEEDIVDKVTSSLHICLYRNNLPAVRQFLETFGIQVYLKFPLLAEVQLIPVFLDYSMRPQALSSYVFIAANVILHSRDVPVQMRHLDKLLPPVIPLLTSHHHSLRCFTQLLVYHVLCKLWSSLRARKSEVVPLAERCFEFLNSYLAENVDCVRLRASMDGFFVNFDPIASATPAGVFNSRSEGFDFECVPISLMDLVTTFLNDVRDDLRYSIAKDVMTIKNESLTALGTSDGIEMATHSSREKSKDNLKDLSVDFQKKITLHKHDRQPVCDESCLHSTPKSSTVLSEMEIEDQLLDSLIESRREVMGRGKESQQQIILVASLLDRIPNLAGLARTCEVFRAACLAIADATIIHDKQFQLISVTAEKWIPIIEVPVCSIKVFLDKKRREGFSILGLEQTANSMPLDKFSFPMKTVLVLGREKEGIPVDIIHVLDACIEIPQLGIIRSLNVHVSGAIALWEYTRQQRCMHE